MRNLTICCTPDNDLLAVLTANGFTCTLKDSPAAAVREAAQGSAVLLLAKAYPDSLNELSAEVFDTAAARQLRLFVEFPSFLPDRTVGEIRTTEIERVVVCGDMFGPALPKMHILMAHGARFVEVTANQPYLAVARIAGFETAVYGLPEKNVYPLLFELPGKSVMVSTTKLSQFVTARFAPNKSWETVWHTVLSWLMPGESIPELTWQPRLRATFARDGALPKGAMEAASKKGAEWFINARILNGVGWTADNQVVGDGSLGVFEGIISKIRLNGTQPYAMAFRNDCSGEVAMALAVRAAFGEKQYAAPAANVLNFIFGPTGFQLDPCNDPASPVYGLFSWSSGSREVYFADDNARALLGMIATSTALNDPQWDERMIRGILANFRVSGVNACQGHNLWEQLIFKFGWEHYWNKDYARLAPHFESWIMACFLWLYQMTGFKPLLERTRRGCGLMMAAYPKWNWANGIQQERARMLLPLAWLVRVDDTPEHRQWVKRISDDLLAAQDSCGAIREELGDPSLGMYGAPKSNEAFGTAEAPLIHINGDPVCDLLYTSNFALVSLTEAAAATGDAKLQKAADRLADFCVRIQIESPTLPTLDGGWFRAFDYQRWEHWGASADGGWGPWCIETGWTQAWIITMLALRDRKTSFWDFTTKRNLSKAMEKVRPEMIPDRVLNEKSKPAAPTNKMSVEVYHDDVWTCYVARDLETTFDLKQPRAKSPAWAPPARTPPPEACAFRSDWNLKSPPTANLCPRRGGGFQRRQGRAHVESHAQHPRGCSRSRDTFAFMLSGKPPLEMQNLQRPGRPPSNFPAGRRTNSGSLLMNWSVNLNSRQSGLLP